MIKAGFGGFVHRAFTGTATGATFNAGGMAESAAAAAADIAATAFGGGAVGAAMGAGGEIAGQGYLISQGYQNSFDWKQFGKTTCGAVIAGTAMGAAFGAAGQTKAGSRFFQWLETPTQFEQNAAKGIKQFLGDNRGSVSIEALLGKGGKYSNLDDGLNFSNKASQHMEESGRQVPVQTLQDAIRYGEALPDPKGSNATMYYTTMYKNGKMYNLEVLYDTTTNTVYHFEYARKAMGNLPAIK